MTTADALKHVVMFSGGIGSYCAARRVVDAHGPQNVTLLFCDTKMEDPDLYRFLSQGAKHLGARLIMLQDGRTPWQVFFHRRFLGNSRVDPCSQILKRDLCKRWLVNNCDASSTSIYVGIDWTEEHRFTRLKDRHAPWRYYAPMCEAPHILKPKMLDLLKADGIDPPRLYAMGFAHNNCGGFCVKAGKAHFANLLHQLPERYAFHEKQEQRLREHLGKDVSILRDRRGGTHKPLTLKNFRQTLENSHGLEGEDRHEWGGCGCFSG